MATPVFHPCRFGFDDQDIRRVGSTTSGGTALSGVDDTIETDGGGYWQADFGNGETMDRDTTLAWRAINAAMDNGSAPVIVEFCDKLHQPIGGEMGIAGQGDQLLDLRSYAPTGVTAQVVANANLRATTLAAIIASEIEVEGGERFTIDHPTWGPRCYEVLSKSGTQVKFRPPLREAITVGTPLDFENPRCKMRRISDPSNALSIGRYGSCSITFVEDMRKP